VPLDGGSVESPPIGRQNVEDEGGARSGGEPVGARAPGGGSGGSGIFGFVREKASGQPTSDVLLRLSRDGGSF
jgi:hypothetical protein